MIKRDRFEKLDFITYFPDNFTESKQYPVIIFLHGAGTREKGFKTLEKNVSFVNLCKYKNEDCIIIEPHCTVVDWFELMQDLIAFCEHILSESYTDKSRFYLTGNSMGGYGCFELGIIRPQFFAAIMPVCGGGTSWNGGQLKSVPVWAFHGLQDDYVPYQGTVNMVNAINQSGGNAKITLYAECGHNCWEKAYTNTEALDWLLSNQKGKTEVNEKLTGEKFG